MLCFFFFKQKTAYEMRISDWSSDVCSSDLRSGEGALFVAEQLGLQQALGDRRAVYGDEALLRALGLGVQEARHDLLTGAGFTGNQDAGVGGGHLQIGRAHV